MKLKTSNLPNYEQLLQLAHSEQKYKLLSKENEFYLDFCLYVGLVYTTCAYLRNSIFLNKAMALAVLYYLLFVCVIPSILDAVYAWLGIHQFKLSSKDIDVLLKIYRELGLSRVKKLSCKQRKLVVEKYSNYCSSSN